MQTDVDKPVWPNVNTTYEIFILILAVISFIGIILVYFSPVEDGVKRILLLVDTGICFVFLFDFGRNLIVTPNRSQYLRWGWLDLLGSIPFVSIFRIGRLHRIIISVIRLRKVKTKQVMHQFSDNRAQSALLSTALVATLAVIISSILILRLERLSPEGNIKTGEDALWWALVTITTVGYGDFYPVSDLGRIIGAIVIIVGVGLYGVIISFLASNFISQKEIDQSEMINQMSNEITEIKKILQDKDSKE